MEQSIGASSRDALVRGFEARFRAFERYAAWERDHRLAPRPEAALSAVGLLFDLLPPEARRRPVDTRGVGAMQRALSVLDRPAR